ncbi:MAG TPA: TetR/AcrR family transcriptional regulator [Rhizomicrobium sp.]|nr:TetR/AcrR family transcriptional regulator [Rhizomicrobium sp.]
MERRAWSGAIQDRSEQFEMKRQIVLRTAARVFSQRGFHQTTLTDIAKELHIAKPTLYHYFKSKDEILLEVQQAAIAQMTAVELNPQSTSRTGRELFEAFVDRYVTMIVDDFGTCLIKTGDLPLEPANRKAIRKGSKGIEMAMRAILKRGADDKSLARCDVKMEAMFLFGTLNWIPYWFRPDGELSVEELAQKVTRSLLTRLAPLD